MYKKLLLYASVIFLAIIPFFWLKPGEIDLGGDSSRLYFYDPINYLKSFPLYAVAPNGFNTENNASYLIPFTLSLAMLQKILFAPYLLVTVINSISLVVAFLSIYGILVMFLQYIDRSEKKINTYFAAITGAIFYTLSPLLTDGGWWKAALMTHNQFFLNPLMLFLLLRYVVTKNFTYMLIFLLLSIIFSPNFFLSPYFFSFYPLAFLFLITFSAVVIRTHPPIKEIFVACFLYVLLHSIYLFQQVGDLFQSSSQLNQLVFSESGKLDRGLGYFLSVQGTTKIANHILGLPQGLSATPDLHSLWVIIPMLVLGGLILRQKVGVRDKKTENTLLLILIFFLLTFFFATAKMTYTTLELYKFFFTIPGFGMFRNYAGQFSHVFVFYYSLVFGMSLFYLFAYLKDLGKKLVLLITILILFPLAAIPFIKGEWTRESFNPGSKVEITMPIRLGLEYERVLDFIREGPFDGKYLLLPLDDSGAQVLRGEKGGYVGPPTIAYVTGKSVFSGLSGFEPFYKVFSSMVMNKDYEGLANLFSLLNMKYVFYNSDDAIYGDNFSGYPYAQARRFMPLTQETYREFFELLPLEKQTELGSTSHLYELNNTYYRPHIYAAKQNYAVTDNKPFSFALPLPFDGNDRRSSLFYSSDIGKSTTQDLDGLLIAAKRESTLLKEYSKKSDHLTVSTSVTPDMYTLLHPLLSLPEKLVNDEENKLYRIYFDQSINASSKIIKDLTNEIDGGLDGALLDERVEDYNERMFSLIQMIYTERIGLYSPFINLVKLGKLLVHDRNTLITLIENSKTLSEDEKRAKRDSLEKAFLQIEHLVSSQSAIPRTNYVAHIPQEGTYEVYTDTRSTSMGKDEVSITAGTESFNLKETQSDAYWMRVGEYKAEDKEDVQFLLTTLETIDPSEALLGITQKELISASGSANLKAQGTLLDFISNIVGSVSDWQENTTYVISFEYTLKNSIDWKKYKAVVETGDEAKEALFLVLNNQNNAQEQIVNFYAPSDIDVRNLAIVPVTTPRILLKKEESAKGKSIPRITFTKVNPTKYEVRVEGASNPYTLVFSDIFSNNWKIFLRNSDEKKNTQAIIASYYDGEVNEGKHRNAFLEAATFETWKSDPIADSKHFMVNGYANAWYIEPKDVKGKTDYTLILEMTSQRTYYPLLFLSATASGVCLVWLAFIYLKQIPKFRRK